MGLKRLLGSKFDEIVIDVEQRQIKMDASLKLGYYLTFLICLYYASKFFNSA